ncbi:MAG: hypothetical protein QGG56_07770, partial [Dehalococcoidia bacterium]|nr:hypothetical protein [Dehalococcoidia bacterium]
LLLSWGYSTPLPGAHSTPSALFGFIPPRSVQLSLTVYSRTLFERTLTYANHLGLFLEMVDPQTGKMLGNFP